MKNRENKYGEGSEAHKAFQRVTGCNDLLTYLRQNAIPMTGTGPTPPQYRYELVVNGVHTGILMDAPIYGVYKIKAVYPLIKRKDSIFYRFVENPVKNN